MNKKIKTVSDLTNFYGLKEVDERTPVKLDCSMPELLSLSTEISEFFPVKKRIEMIDKKFLDKVKIDFPQGASEIGALKEEWLYFLAMEYFRKTKRFMVQKTFLMLFQNSINIIRNETQKYPGDTQSDYYPLDFYSLPDFLERSMENLESCDDLTLQVIYKKLHNSLYSYRNTFFKDIFGIEGPQFEDRGTGGWLLKLKAKENGISHFDLSTLANIFGK